jgi:DNA-binding LytR/AlgR family response regulator
MVQVNNGREEFQIPLADIRYVKAASNYFEIHTVARRYLVYGQLKTIEALLPAPRFVRIHRSYIVALDRVRVVSGATLTLDDAELAVGPAYRQQFHAAWTAWRDSMSGEESAEGAPA